jgi:tungstate transport system ATP-binding protein
VLLDVLCLDVRRGEILAIVGPNGAGKSTLAGVLSMVERPTAGDVWFEGRRVVWKPDPLALRRRVAMAFQQPLLFDTSVFENVATGLRLRGIPKAEIRERVDLWLDRLKIGHLTSRSARSLSGGESQRTSLARALVLDPDLLLLDEPFGALDPPTREALIDDLVPLLRKQTTTALLITHDHDEALELGDRVGVLLEGRLAQVDSPSGLLHRPATAAVARFIRVRSPRSWEVRGACSDAGS